MNGIPEMLRFKAVRNHDSHSAGYGKAFINAYRVHALSLVMYSELVPGMSGFFMTAAWA